MRVAIVHDWLTVYAGAERVLEQILTLYPDADLFSVIDHFPEDLRSHIRGKRATTTFIQKLPFVKRLYRAYLPLMPLAIEQLDVSGYDLVISSSHAVAKGVLTAPDQRHLCYCYSPMRYAWDLQNQYLKEKRSPLKRYLLHKLRLWDARSAHGVDAFACISHFIAGRIQKSYRRDSVVIYPPVSVENFALQENKERFFLTASRLVPYKRVDAIVEAFKFLPGEKLVVIGEGPERGAIEKGAPDNVTFLGHVSHDKLQEMMGKARAFIYAAVEDFGISPLEAQACGTGVIAYKRGAVCETLPITGHFFTEQTPEAIAHAVQTYVPPDPKLCRKNAERFTIHRFRDNFSKWVNDDRTHLSRRERHEAVASVT